MKGDINKGKSLFEACREIIKETVFYFIIISLEVNESRACVYMYT